MSDARQHLNASSQTAGETTAGAWEERWHPLREEWVIIASHRNQRPWTGETLNRQPEVIPPFVADCYLCPGNARVQGHRNPDYQGIFVFDNDLPCVSQDSPSELAPPAGIFRNRRADGAARVVCYSPLHNTTLAELPVHEIRALLKCWQEQYRELGSMANVNHVLIFENKGKVVGVSNPHPHCQIYATNFVFKTIAVEADASARYLASERRVLFEEVIASEKADGRRIVMENDSAISFIPYFARYAYEAYAAPKQAYQSIAELSAGELSDLAAVLKDLLVRYDNLWQMSFPYVLVLHQAPTDGKKAEGFHFHIEFHPPLRTPTLLKYLAGPEIGGGSFLSDTSPEQKAAELRALADVHYKSTSEATRA
jgi:UDPglucose--hexose-1-phosphate uridylyltransferase